MNWPKKVLQAQIESLIAQREELETRLEYVMDRLSDSKTHSVQDRQTVYFSSEAKLDDTLVFDEPVHHGPPAELANLRADLEAVCLERDAALEREGELQRRIHNLQVATDGYRIELLELDRLRTEAKNLRANCDLFQRERDQAWQDLQKLRASIQRRPVDSTPGTC